jgi:hypothetical protein
VWDREDWQGDNVDLGGKYWWGKVPASYEWLYLGDRQCKCEPDDCARRGVSGAEIHLRRKKRKTGRKR